MHLTLASGSWMNRLVSVSGLPGNAHPNGGQNDVAYRSWNALSSMAPMAAERS
jgi:hypothetical protein